MNGEEPNNNWTLSYNKLVELHKNMNAKRKLPGAKVYDLRLYDIVVGNDKPTKAHGKNVSSPPIRIRFQVIKRKLTGLLLEGREKVKNPFMDCKDYCIVIGMIMGKSGQGNR